MTKREFLNAVLAVENLPEELTITANEMIAQLDATNEKRKNRKPSAKELEKQAENNALKEQILNDILNEIPVTASVVASNLGISTQKASSLLRALVAEGFANVTEVKVPQKGNQKAYSVVSATDAQ